MELTKPLLWNGRKVPVVLPLSDINSVTLYFHKLYHFDILITDEIYIFDTITENLNFRVLKLVEVQFEKLEFTFINNNNLNLMYL